MPLLRPLARLYSTTTTATHPILNRTYAPIYDHLSPINTHLLRTALQALFQDALPTYPTDVSPTNTLPLPPAYHLAHFPPFIPESDLLPDGSDRTQSPGGEWVRRMWAGGSLKFDYGENAGGGLRIGKLAVCREEVTGVKAKGEGEDEKLFVEFLRKYAMVEGERELEAAVVEKRDIVFFKGEAKKANPRVIQAARPPTFSHTFTPSPHLLFRFSALSYNAHKIHFDPVFTASEGHGAPLVHGPLMLVMMVEAASRRVSASGKRVTGIEYRNVKPVPVGREIRVCGREKEREGELEVWVELEGGLAVKGTVTVE